MMQRRDSRQGGSAPRRGPGSHMAAMMKGDSARDFKGSMKKLIDYLGKYKLTVLIVMVFAVGSRLPISPGLNCSAKPLRASSRASWRK